jgi:hypothetical protein
MYSLTSTWPVAFHKTRSADPQTDLCDFNATQQKWRKEISENQKTKSQIAKPNRGVDHRQLRFDFQLRSAEEVAT